MSNVNLPSGSDNDHRSVPSMFVQCTITAATLILIAVPLFIFGWRATAANRMTENIKSQK